MFLIVGYLIVLAASLGTYAVHGSLASLWVPTEYIALVGLALGSFVSSNNLTIIKATLGALPSLFKGS
ncbi:MAG: flagellar motor stator protein MotA, partial [Candidatus Accumulibacter sp.]|nr:flagellar motor stator protein MotA [Accumulibacter sp.]